MLEPNDRPSPSKAGRVQRITVKAPGPTTVRLSEGMNRPVGVTVISALYLSIGCVLLLATLGLIFDLLTNPRAFVHTFIYAMTWGIAICLPPLATLFVLTA